MMFIDFQTGDILLLQVKICIASALSKFVSSHCSSLSIHSISCARNDELRRKIAILGVVVVV